MDKKSFIFYINWRQALRDFPKNVRLEVYEAILDYAETGEICDLSPVAKGVFSLIKVSMDEDSAKYINTCESRRAAGSRGGRSKAESTKCKQRVANIANATKRSKRSKCQQNVANVASVANVADNDSDNDMISTPTNVVVDNKPPLNPKGFVSPSLAEMKNYFAEKGYTEQAAEKAYAYYSELGWKDSKGNQIQNWKVKCVTVWFKEENKKSSRPWGQNVPV